MSVSIMTETGLIEVPTRSGGKSGIAGQAAPDGRTDHGLTVGTGGC